jgi:hypothetical protein
MRHHCLPVDLGTLYMVYEMTTIELGSCLVVFNTGYDHLARRACEIDATGRKVIAISAEWRLRAKGYHAVITDNF